MFSTARAGPRWPKSSKRCPIPRATPRSGRYSLRDLPEDWYVQSIRSGAWDVQKDGLEVGAAPVTPVEMVLADDGARIEGVVRNANDELLPGARVVLIPASDRRGPFSEFFLTAETNLSGADAIERVPPGEYRLLALDEAGMPAVQWEAPECLQEFEPRGERVSVDPGARMTINVEAFPIYE